VGVDRGPQRAERTRSCRIVELLEHPVGEAQTAHEPVGIVGDRLEAHRLLDAVEIDAAEAGGFVLRYRNERAHDLDSLPSGEGCLLPCTLWLADTYTLQRRTDEAGSTSERVSDVASDVPLFAHE
jgi:hypothetical protein